MKKIYWTTKEGQRIWIRDMTDSHLAYAIKFMEKKIFEHLLGCQRVIETLKREQGRRMKGALK